MIKNNISRRGFMGVTGAAIGAMAVPVSLAAMEPVTLHGDGVHDDTEALEALFAGRPVRVVKEGVVARNENGTVRLINGNFRTRSPIRAYSDTNLYCGHCTFRVGETTASPYPMLVNID